jgi:glycosyltransferase involved in cell wall biosynthesis
MKTIKVSFIIPAYNVEKYIARCLDSVLMQEIDKEIIVINDGSTDSTLNLLEDYAQSNSCIRIISKPNGGQSSARNIGIKIAKGEYLCFMDSDDYYLCDFAGDFYKKCIDYNLDIVTGQYARVYESDKQISVKYDVSFLNMPILTYDFLISSVNQHAVEVVPWLGIMKRDYVIKNHLKFVEGYFYEDQLFYLEMLLCQKPGRIMQTDCCFYGYRMHGESTIHVSNIKKFTDIIAIMKRQYTFINKRQQDGLKLCYWKAAYHVCSLTMCHLISVYLRLSPSDKKLAYRKVPLWIKVKSLSYADNAREFVKILAFILMPALLYKMYQKKEA